MKERRDNLISGIAFLAFAVFIYIFSFKIQMTTSDILGSRFFPRVVAAAIALLSIIQICGSFSKSGAECKEKEVKTEKTKWNKPLALTTIALFAYYIIITYIGFVPTSIMYLLFQCYVLMSEENRKNKKTLIIMAVVSVLVPLFLNFVFWNIFSIRLPMGKLFK